MNERVVRVESLAKLLARQSMHIKVSDRELDEYWNTLHGEHRADYLKRARAVLEHLNLDWDRGEHSVELIIHTPGLDAHYALADVKVTDIQREVKVSAEAGGERYYTYGTTLFKAMWQLIGQRLPD